MVRKNVVKNVSLDGRRVVPASGDETLKVSSGNLKRGPGQVANKYKLASLPRAPARRRPEEAPVPVRPHADLDVAVDEGDAG